MLDETPFWHVELSDGRVLEAVSGGPENGMPLVFQNGTPTAAMLFAPLVETAAARGLRTVMYSRPGYAGSTAKPGRSVADAASDVGALLDAIGADSSSPSAGLGVVLTRLRVRLCSSIAALPPSR
jgi:pimeloyl-ACP methyl ester carboxylesterase